MIMNHEHVVTQLLRSQGGRSLVRAKELCIREQQRADIMPSKFDNYIIDEKYIIFRDQIIYFYNKERQPFADGILESEKLKTDGISRVTFEKGPLRIEGSNNFYQIFTKN
jgi:hypothetical protein